MVAWLNLVGLNKYQTGCSSIRVIRLILPYLELILPYLGLRLGGCILFSVKSFCIPELSLHAEFYILIKFCGGWSTASKEAESPSREGGGGGKGL